VLKTIHNSPKEKLIVPKDFPSNLMPVYIAPTFNKPTFLIVGELDDRTPVWMSREIYDLIPANVPKELWVVKNANHGGQEAPEIVANKEFYLRVEKFLKENL